MTKTVRIGVVGLGYVGLPVAVAFAKQFEVIGYDVNAARVTSLQAGVDLNGEVAADDLLAVSLQFTTDVTRLQACNFIIMTVPTPIDHAKKPDFNPLIQATTAISSVIRPGSIIVYESTVYPGATEEICVPILEQSGLKRGVDFYVGYSPERINPGDTQHTFTTITKIVSAEDDRTLEIIAETYGKVIEAGIYRVTSIKVAEAAKILENTQRDLNIALMNEMSVICQALGISTYEVLAAAGTKWNFLKFTPGLVGGHCIGVDPYYLTHKAEQMGYHPQVILAGRRINDSMGIRIAQALIKKLIHLGVSIKGSIVTILGVTFKENVSDFRNSKVIDVIHELQEFGIYVQITDDLVDRDAFEAQHDMQLTELSDLKQADLVILAVPHRKYVEMGWSGLAALLSNDNGLIADIKGVLKVNEKPHSMNYWSL